MKPALIEIVKWLADITLIGIGILCFILVVGAVIFGVFKMFYW